MADLHIGLLLLFSSLGFGLERKTIILSARQHVFGSKQGPSRAERQNLL